MPDKPVSSPKAYKMMCVECGYRWTLIETGNRLRKESTTWIDEENECEETRAVIRDYVSGRVSDVCCPKCDNNHTAAIDVWHLQTTIIIIGDKDG